MTAVLSISGVLLMALAVAAFALVRRLGLGESTLPVTSEWIDQLSSNRYRPMVRLLDASDIHFLRSQPGFNRKLEATLRGQRCEIFQGYLRLLDLDFKRVCLAIKVILANSEQDRPELAAAFAQQRILFTSGLLAAYFRLFLYRWGICTVDVSSLVTIFEGMRVQLRELVPSAIPVCA